MINHIAKKMGDGIKVFIGLQKGSLIDIKPLLYDKSANPETMDDVLSEICLNSRQITKLAFSGSYTQEVKDAIKEISIPSIYNIPISAIDGVDERFVWGALAENIVIIYLTSKTQWCIGGNVPEFNQNNANNILKPRLIKDFIKNHYKDHYPEEVLNACLANSKDILRVISCNTFKDREEFVLESLVGSTTVKKITVAI